MKSKKIKFTSFILSVFVFVSMLFSVFLISAVEAADFTKRISYNYDDAEETNSGSVLRSNSGSTGTGVDILYL